MLLENIRELCKVYTISITNLEKVLGFGNGTITKWDKASPSLEKVTAVARFFEITVSELIGETKKAHPQFEDELDGKLVEMLKDLTPSEVVQVLAFAEGLKANRKA